MIARSLLVCGLCLVLSAGAARAELSCPQPVFQAGQATTGTVLRHHFVLANSGQRTIELTGVKPSCGCLKPHLDKVQLAPGEQMAIVVEVNTLTQPPGPSSWRVTVSYRDGGEEGALELYVRAQLVRDLSIQPAALVLHTAAGLSHTFTLTENRERPVEIRAAVCRSPHVRTQLGEPRRQPEGWVRTVTVEVLPSCPEGRHEDVLELQSSDPRYPELKAPFTILKRSPGKVHAAPAAVQLAGYKDQPLPSRIILLSTSDEQPVVIERVEPSHPCIRCTYSTGPGALSTLRVQVEVDKMPAGPFTGGVRVQCRQPAGQTMTIPVQVSR